MNIVFYFLVIVPSAIIHEYMHGWMADRLGDPTPRMAGRLTLDPMAHIDPVGTIALPLLLSWVSGGSFLFAYAKPVPFDPALLRTPRWGTFFVGMAGPCTNLIIALVLGALVRFIAAMGGFSLGPTFIELLSIVVYANVLLAIFNLVPIPPLDGSRLLNSLLGHRLAGLQMILERYGFILVLLFAFYGFQYITPIVHWVFGLIVGA